MTHRLSANRAICDGDRARAGVGEHAAPGAIQHRIAGWSTPFLKSFLSTCKSEPWRKEVHKLILIREGVQADLSFSNSKKARRKRRGSKQAQSFGRALRVP